MNFSFNLKNPWAIEGRKDLKDLHDYKMAKQRQQHG